ncbi:hypothetical protein BYT27DRAFT_7113181, partial [Phlegmacium glaucopus]
LQFLTPTKARELDTIRLRYVVTHLLLCHPRWGRDYQQQHGVVRRCTSDYERE